MAGDARTLLVWYLEACRAAGREVAETGAISPETQDVLDRPLIEDPREFAAAANAFIQGQLGVSPADAAEEASTGAPAQPLPPPAGTETMRDLVAGMALAFNAGAAGDMRAVIQFEVTGDETGQYYLDIAAGRCRTHSIPPPPRR